MPVLRLVSSVTHQEFMRAIRPKPLAQKTMAELEEFAQMQPTLAALGTNRWKHLFKRFGVSDPGMFERQIVASTLRVYVDEWIGTGVVPGVGEVPRQRDLRKAPAAAKSLHDYAEKNPLTPAVTPKGRELVFEVCRPPVEGSAGWARPSDPVNRAFVEASRLFAGLMWSEWGQQLCKCRYTPCGRYFLKERARCAPLVHGTFCCREHQRKASATHSVRRRRAQERQELTEAAAAILVRWRIAGPQWQTDQKRKRQLASALSATRLCQRHKLVLAANWVTRHSREIEKIRSS